MPAPGAGTLSVAAVVVAYNSGDALERCLDSLAGEADEIVVVNNGDPLSLERQEVRLVEAGGNAGFGAGCNLGVEHVSSDVVVFLNPDTVTRPGSVRALAGALDDASVGVVQARLRLAEAPELLNSAGNVLHPSGLAWPGGYGEPAASVAAQREIAYASGAACAIRTALFRELGGFTEELFLYQEDLELSWRVRLRGLRVVVDPAADAVHDYVVERLERRKQYYLERNRLVFVLTAYGGRMLALLAPLLVVVELAISALALREGWFREKARGWLWLVRNAGWLRAHRRRLQAERRVPDRELAPLFSPSVGMPMVAQPPGIELFNVFARAWWRGVRVFL